MEKNQAHSVDQCWLQALQFFMHLISLFSILHRCNGFARVQKVVVDQMGSRPLNSDHDLILCKFGFRKCFGVSSQPDHWANHHWLSYTIHFSLHITIWSQSHVVFPQNKRRQHFKMMIIFLFVVSSWCSSSLRLSSPLQNFLNYHCTIHLLAAPGPNALLMSQVVCCFMTHLNMNKKLFEFAFCLNSFL